MQTLPDSTWTVSWPKQLSRLADGVSTLILRAEEKSYDRAALLLREAQRTVQLRNEANLHTNMRWKHAMYVACVVTIGHI